jgi:hypothetical protein
MTFNLTNNGIENYGHIDKNKKAECTTKNIVHAAVSTKSNLYLQMNSIPYFRQPIPHKTTQSQSKQPQYSLYLCTTSA